jgi:hypothetical protein
MDKTYIILLLAEGLLKLRSLSDKLIFWEKHCTEYEYLETDSQQLSVYHIKIFLLPKGYSYLFLNFWINKELLP